MLFYYVVYASWHIFIISIKKEYLRSKGTPLLLGDRIHSFINWVFSLLFALYNWSFEQNSLVNKQKKCSTLFFLILKNIHIQITTRGRRRRKNWTLFFSVGIRMNYKLRCRIFGMMNWRRKTRVKKIQRFGHFVAVEFMKCIKMEIWKL